MKLLLLRGLPGSGKSTYAAELLKPGGEWKRVNKDTLREMLDQSDWSPRNEYLLNTMVYQMIAFYLKAGFNVVSDNCNLDPERIRELMIPVGRLKAEGVPIDIIAHEIHTPLEECIARDTLRPVPVGESVIRKMAAKWVREEKFRGLQGLINHVIISGRKNAI